jgi:hypothetical protein
MENIRYYFSAIAEGITRLATLRLASPLAQGRHAAITALRLSANALRS